MKKKMFFILLIIAVAVLIGVIVSCIPPQCLPCENVLHSVFGTGVFGTSKFGP